MTSLLDDLASLIPFLATTAAVIVFIAAVNWGLRRRWRDNPNIQFRFQLIMLGLSFAGMLGIIVALPINDALRGQLLSLIGILLSAAIALSSTTFIGNIMAGIMMRIVKNARPGDFITVAELTGRITEMDLLHTEIQTEFRDLVTVPNLYMVTQPLQVVRASGTIIQAEVSLGYDVPNTKVTDVLCAATREAGLKDGFVQVRELGDFSVVYRVAGLLEDVTSLISSRSRLRAAILNALHEANIEIVSPNFMNTRALKDNERFIPVRTRQSSAPAQDAAERLAFDKAEEAASIEQIRAAIDQTDAELNAESETVDPAVRTVLEEKRLRLIEELKTAEEASKAKEAAEKGGGDTGK